jgi:hypothetical protein
MTHSLSHAGSAYEGPAEPAAFGAGPQVPPLWSVTSAVGLIFAVLREALAAQRSYERLRREGLPDAKAIRQAFFGPER